MSSSSKSIRAGIYSGSGCTAGELLRWLQTHPRVEISFVQSHSRTGEQVALIHSGLWQMNHHFIEEGHHDVDIAFICSAHGQAKPLIDAKFHGASSTPRLIDLTGDHRLDPRFVYGLTEWNRDALRHAKWIANPGCFATAIQLAMLPIAKASGWVGDVHIHAITGATGAGLALQESTQYVRRSDDISAYKIFQHQHLLEIHASIQKWQNPAPKVHFVPIRGPMSRGIFCSLSGRIHPGLDVSDLLEKTYKNETFVHVRREPIHLKDVRGSNHVLIHAHQEEDMVHISCGLDNLVKGAVGQAIQNMNQMFGWDESFGLNAPGFPI